MATVERTSPQLREVPLSQITVAEGFNPRGEVSEDAELLALAETIRQRGCLMPVRVRAAESGGYVLIAGERRYRAAALAGLTEIPATVIAPGDADEHEQRELLTDALVENEVRRDLNPLQRALGFKAMRDSGLTVKGIAERLGGTAGRRAREHRIREHLEILALPEELSTQVGSGAIPLLAVKALVGLAKIHDDLAGAAVAAVTDAVEGDEPYTWQDVAAEPLAVAVNNLEELPLGLFNTARSHPIARFTLGEKAQRDLRAYERLTGRELAEVRFTPELLERPRALGAVHDCGWFAILAGQAVADSLAEDYVARSLKRERAWRRDRRKRDQADAPAPGVGRGPDGEPLDGGEDEENEDASREDAKAARRAARERREHAVKFNAELGLLAFKHLPRLKIDERAVRILASVDLGRSLREIAVRGAKLAMPGWAGDAAGHPNPLYLDDGEAAAKAAEFLAGASTPAEVAGRVVTLLALAEFADEAVLPQSRRSWYGLPFLNGPWADQAREDLVAIVRERIKEGQFPELDAVLDTPDVAHDA